MSGTPEPACSPTPMSEPVHVFHHLLQVLAANTVLLEFRDEALPDDFVARLKPLVSKHVHAVHIPKLQRH